jgi:transposase
MLTLPSTIQIFLCPEPVDLRRGLDGLRAVAIDRVARDPRNGGLFLFTNRRRDSLRALCFDRNGMVLLAKRLDRGTFCWPRAPEGASVLILEVSQLALLLAGLPLPTGSSFPTGPLSTIPS